MSKVIIAGGGAAGMMAAVAAALFYMKRMKSLAKSSISRGRGAATSQITVMWKGF